MFEFKGTFIAEVKQLVLEWMNEWMNVNFSLKQYNFYEWENDMKMNGNDRLHVYEVNIYIDRVRLNHQTLKTL